jgi:diaminohydroxyphosphoribosylaminopyrimidine deaminase/5-amino-6-(5-phosphoribosylamino)uracil reductase
LFLARAYELAARGRGNTSPNPNVGAVFVRDGAVIGEGYHHKAGEAHAEIEALRAAGDVTSATLYVSLEPCAHEGRTGSCARALAPLGLARVVIGTLDPNPLTHGMGAQMLRDAGAIVELADDDEARRLIEPFAVAIERERPFVSLKMAISLDGFAAAGAGVRTQLTGDAWSAYVRDLRAAHDAVMVGAGTVRVDDPLLTVRPPRKRLRPYVRIVVEGREPIPPRSRVLAPVAGYAPTIVLSAEGDGELDLDAAMDELYRQGIRSILCEGGPVLATALIERDLVDRFYWAIAPVMLGPQGVPALSPTSPVTNGRALLFDTIERFDNDVMLSGKFAPCSAV